MSFIPWASMLSDFLRKTIKTGTPPAKSTKQNVDTMIEQYKRMGVMYDWKYSLDTTTPEYYRWTQWLFLEMYKNKLAYKKLGNVNWCPKDQTVLANEQCQDGKCERCGTEVVQLPLEQWYWNITKYSQNLLDGLSELDWPEKTKLMQRNWIGRSDGAEVVFDVADSKESVTIFTTRVDTLFSAAFLVLAPEHPFVAAVTKPGQKKAIDEYVKVVAKKTELQRTDLAKEKTGVFTGSFAINPANGKRIPIWIGDFVLAHYGKGAVFGDAHDERDFIFAKKYGLTLTTTILPVDESKRDAVKNFEKCFTEDGVLYDSGEFSGQTSAEARKNIAAWLEKKGKGKPVVTYRLRDWLVSRQRYWGAPIPIVYDPGGKPHPIPEKHLPWLLPTDVEFKPTGKSPLTESKEFIARTEKIFGKGWRPEFDTMDTFVCSSFYYLRYLMDGDPKNFVDKSLEKKWMPVSMYIGGPEHACMHLIYARFVMMALKDFGYVSHLEPFKKLVHQGLITNKGAKMSKSKGNVVSPDEFVNKFGSDVFRMYLMFMGPFMDGGDWSDSGIMGIVRFSRRFYKAMSEKMKTDKRDDDKITSALHKTIKKVTEDIAELKFNTAISAIMELLNLLEKEDSFSTEVAKTVTLLLTPIAPHLAEECWAILKSHSAEASRDKGFAAEQTWPKFNEKFLVEKTITIVVQVNGKVRGDLVIDAKEKEPEVIKKAKELENVKKFLTGPIKKEIYIPGRLVSLVI